MSKSSPFDTNTALQKTDQQQVGCGESCIAQRHAATSAQKKSFLVVQLAQAYLDRRYSAKARKCVTEAVRRSPGNPAVLSGAASVLLDLGELDRAQEMIVRARAAAPDSPQIALQKANIHERGPRTEEAFEEISTALTAAPDSQRALMMKGKVLQRQKKYTDAENTLQDLVKAESVDLIAHLEGGYELARVLEAQGNYSRAMEVSAAPLRGAHLSIAGQTRAVINDIWL